MPELQARHQPQPGKCKKTCVEACGDRKAIDFTQKEEIEEIKVGTIIVATGFKTFDAERLPQYGYGTYPNVYTALEVERLVNASGPTGGEVVLRDGRNPRASASSTASARATRRPTAGARASAACIR
jgi:heterodisulfide reductase subunit A2